MPPPPVFGLSTSRALPDDVLLKTALFVEHPDDCFSFLEAVRAAGTLPGHLEHLWQLGHVKNHSDLWPALRLSADDEHLSEASRQDLKAVAKYYTVVHVQGFPISMIDALQFDSFDPKAEWHVEMTADMVEKAWSEWLNVRITSLTMDMLHWKGRTIQTALNSLARFHHLKTFKLSMPDGDKLVASAVEFASGSAKLTALELECFSPDLTPSIARNLTLWFKRQPVRVFKFPAWRTGRIDMALQQVVDQVVFNCPTIDKLTCSGLYLQSVDLTSWTFPMPSFELNSFLVRTEELSTAFASHLVGSGVRHLAITIKHRVSCDYLRGPERLFQVLDETQTTSLEISGCLFDHSAWRALAKCLPQYRQLKTLKLVQSIQHLDVRDNVMDVASLKSLIQACTDPTRSVRMLSLEFEGCGISRDEYWPLRAFADDEMAFHF
ncbi:hypothetical protein AC1031_007802 [Aphanomyces cochlioides]|nr:hypothetical protein AC1031_007802 [Aphanomyces cochlioides]